MSRFRFLVQNSTTQGVVRRSTATTTIIGGRSSSSFGRPLPSPRFFSTAHQVSDDDDEHDETVTKDPPSLQQYYNLGFQKGAASPKNNHKFKDGDNKIISPMIVQGLESRVRGYKDKIYQNATTGERTFCLDPLPIEEQDVYQSNTQQTAQWLLDQITSDDDSKNNVILYIGFEAFYEDSFDDLAALVASSSSSSSVSLKYSNQVKSSLKYLQNREHYQSLETATTNVDDSDLTSSSSSSSSPNDAVVVHLGATHAMDRMLFGNAKDEQVLQQAWQDGRMVIISPLLTVAPNLVYRASLSGVVNEIAEKARKEQQQQQHNWPSTTTSGTIAQKPKRSIDYPSFDKDIQAARAAVEEARTMEDAFYPLYRLVSKYVTAGQLNSPCYFDSGWEAFRLYKELSGKFAANSESSCNEDDVARIPWTRAGLVNSRNAAIGDSLHAFYATAPDAFPIAVCGDTAALLAGGISMINIHSQNRFGVVIIPNNRGMAIEDVISKRSVDGHQYQYEYVKLDKKRDIFTLQDLKDVINKDILASLRDHLWGVSAHRSEAIVLNVDVQSLRKENADKVQDDAVLTGGSFLDEDFGERYAYLQEPRQKLESIVSVLHQELNKSNESSTKYHNPVKIQGCSAIEFMEIFSQLSITMSDKMKFLPTPTDILATRTLLPSLVEGSARCSKFANSNNEFSVFVSNAAFGTDGLNNLISTHLEYGTGTLVHLAYDAAEEVSHYSLVGQVHRNYGNRPSTLLPSLYRNHQAYEGQVVLVNAADENCDKILLDGLRDPNVKVVLVDMGAPNLTAALK